VKTDSDQRIAEKILEVADLEGKEILEIGCGNGRITSFMLGKPKKIIAVDPDRKSIEEARERLAGADFRIGSGEKLEFSEESFDLVIFTLSLHHQGGRTALAEARRVLKDEGRILVIEPVNEGELERIFGVVRNEDHATIVAQKAIKESGLMLECSEVFYAKWVFEDTEDLCRSLFEYYGMPLDAGIALKIRERVGVKGEGQPIVLIDTMIIQSLRKPF